MEYDLIIVGAGISGATVAALNRDKRVLVIERNEIGGQLQTQQYNDITTHRHGPRIFHSADKRIWDFLNGFGDFNGYVHQEKALVDDKLYDYPINLGTLQELYGVSAPDTAKQLITPTSEGENLEEALIYSIGDDLYTKFYEEYLKKFYGVPATKLPRHLISDIDVRTTHSSVFYREPYQGVPEEGWTVLIERMLEHADVIQADFLANGDYRNLADAVVYTGAIDELFGYKRGRLPYRSFINRISIEPEADAQGCTTIRYCDGDTNIISVSEHKHMDRGCAADISVTSSLYGTDYSENRGLLRQLPMPYRKANDMWLEYMTDVPDHIYPCGPIANYMPMTISQAIQDAFSVSDDIQHHFDK